MCKLQFVGTLILSGKMATNLQWHHPLVPCKKTLQYSPNHHHNRRLLVVQSFRRGDFDAFKRRVSSGEFWRDANDRFEQLVYETKKTAESIDRRYSVSRRLSAVAQSASYRAKELDNEFAISQRWRNFTLDWPRVSSSYPPLYIIAIYFILFLQVFIVGSK